MVRMARVVIPDYPHHITQRGNRRQKTFFSEDDYQYYIDLVSKFSKQCGAQIWAYCLMPNHVHLVMVPNAEDSLRTALGESHRRYTRHINFRMGWRGHLWQERFHSFTMDEQYLLSTVRYIENNPVAARLCARQEDWRWSSALAHIKGEDDKLVQVKPMLDRVTNWTDYLTETTNMDEEALLQLHTRTGRPLGNTSFVQQLEAITGKALAPKMPGRKAKNLK